MIYIIYTIILNPPGHHGFMATGSLEFAHVNIQTYGFTSKCL